MVAATHDSQLVDRTAYLCDLVTGKSVLDIGVVEHSIDAVRSPLWLHGRLRKSAQHCLGVDILEEEVKILRDQGYEVVTADIAQSPLPRTFDIIVAGEVIEHIDAPGAFMKNCAKMLNRGGRVVITTPNPFYLNAILKSVLRQGSLMESADHVAWYDAHTLCELGERHGLRLTCCHGIATRKPSSFKAKVFFALAPLLIKLGFAPTLFAKSIIYEFVQADDLVSPPAYIQKVHPGSSPRMQTSP